MTMLGAYERCRHGLHRWIELSGHTFCKWCGEVEP